MPSGLFYLSKDVSNENIDFMKTKLGLDSEFVDIVRTAAYKKDVDLKFYVLYHSEGDNYIVDSYMFSIGFNDSKAKLSLEKSHYTVLSCYKQVNTLIGYHDNSISGENLSSDVVMGVDEDTVTTPLYAIPVPLKEKEGLAKLTSLKKVEQPEKMYVPTTCKGISDLLKQFSYTQLDEERPLKDILDAVIEEKEYSQKLCKFFEIEDNTKLAAFKYESPTTFEALKLYGKFMKENPEYRVFQIGNILGNIGAGMVIGAVAPTIWEQGAFYGVVTTMTALERFLPDGVEGALSMGAGSHVDHAVSSEEPVNELKKTRFKQGIACATSGLSYFLMQPTMLKAISLGYESTVLPTLFGVQILSVSAEDSIKDKNFVAIHKELIEGHHPDRKHELSKRFYELLGTEQLVMNAAYLSSFATVLGLCYYFGMDSAVFPISTFGLGLWSAGEVLWSFYRDKGEFKIEVEGNDYISSYSGYQFDSGWKVDFKKIENGGIVDFNANDFQLDKGKTKYQITIDKKSLSGNDREFGVVFKYNGDANLADIKNKKSFITKLGPLQKLIPKEKEKWVICKDTGRRRKEKSLYISRYSLNDEFCLQKMPNGEYVFGTKEFIDKYTSTLT